MAKLEISKVHDAYKAGGECPLCTLMDGAERVYLASFRGARVMEPSVRVRTNETGFCPAHYDRLYRGENKLGLALLVHTHLKESLPKLRRALEELGGDRKGRGQGKAAGSRKGGQRGGGQELAAGLAEFRDRCFICELLKGDLERYAFTIAYLWKHDPGFDATFRASQGFCLPHFPAVCEAAEAELGKDFPRWVETAVPLMIGSLERLEREVHGFTQLLHGSVKELGSPEERTALARTLQKLTGRLTGLE